MFLHFACIVGNKNESKIEDDLNAVVLQQVVSLNIFSCKNEHVLRVFIQCNILFCHLSYSDSHFLAANLDYENM